MSRIFLLSLFLVFLLQFPAVIYAASISPADWTPFLINQAKTITIAGLNPDRWYFWQETGPSGFPDYTHCFLSNSSGLITQAMGPYTIVGDYTLQLTPDISPNPPITFDPGSTTSGEGCIGSGSSVIGDLHFQVVSEITIPPSSCTTSINPTIVSKSDPKDITVKVDFVIPNSNSTYVLFATKSEGTPGGIAFNIICSISHPSSTPQCTMSIRKSDVKMQVGSFTETLRDLGGNNRQAEFTLVNTQNMDPGTYVISLKNSTDLNNTIAGGQFTILDEIVNDVKMTLSPTSFSSTADSAGKIMTVTLTKPTAEVFDVYFNPDNIIGVNAIPVASINCTSTSCSGGQFKLPSCGLNPSTYTVRVHDRDGVGHIRGVATFSVQGSCTTSPGSACGGYIPLPYNTPVTAEGSQCGTLENPGFNTAIGCIPTNPDKLVKAVLTFVISISGGLAFLLMLLGAFQMLTSAGNPETLQAGRERFTQAIIGLLFIVFSVILLQIIGVDILGLRELRK